MKNTLIISLLLLFSMNNCLKSQSINTNQSKTPNGWTTNNPFKTDVFVENHGQFNNWAITSSPILYALNNSDMILFTKKSIIFRLQKNELLSEEEREKNESIDKSEKHKNVEIYYVEMNWEDCNPNSKIEVYEPTENYYTFGEKGYENVKAKGYKKIIYKNIYQNIDVEYIIPEKGGIKYSIILHPGANISQIKMTYNGSVNKIKKDKKGNIIIETPAGEITDHAPESFYKEDKKQINSAFQLKGKTVSFQLSALNSSDNSQSIIIDPWTTTPTSLFTNNTALDIDYDIWGNVYVSGGSTPYKLSKYSNSGVLLWTFTNPINWCPLAIAYSKFCLLFNSGTAFIGEGYSGSNSGSRVMKISNNGILVNTSSYFGINDEIWKMFYNNCSKQLIAFGGGTQNNHNMKVILDTNLNSHISKNFNGYLNSYNDIASVVMDNYGDFYALMTSTYDFQLEGRLQKSLFSTNYSSPLAFDVQTYYSFKEGGTNLQGVTGNVLTVRVNALAINNYYLFSYDGKTLKAWNKVNGNLIDSIIVALSYTGGNYRLHEGIDVDECNNVYVGGSNKVHIFSFNGNHFNTLNPITTNIYEVQDIKLNKTNGKLMICGVGFITNIDAPISCINSPSGMTVSTTISDSCFGRACLSVSGGIPPYSYLWSNGSTDSCIIGVPAGTYSVIVSDNSCSFNNYFKDTIVMNPAIQLSVSPINPKICLGDTATFIASSSGIGTTFQWSNGSTGNSLSVSPPISTTYTVTANNNFCSDTIPVHVNVNNPHSVSNHTICYGSNFTFGTHIYSNSGVYTDTLSSYFGCDSIIITNLTVKPSPMINLGNDITICEGTLVFLNATYPSATYLWQDNSTNPIFTVTQAGQYWVKSTIDSCSSMDSIKIAIKDCEVLLELPNIITPNNDGKNDLFIPLQSKNIEKMNTQIFNRWGNLIYETDKLEIEWNGMVNIMVLL